MCGIAGLWSRDGDVQAARSIANRMAGAIRHRGPDDSGVWSGGPGRPTFAHQRLSIIDLSPGGHQPMESPSGRHVVVFNGEIYNHRQLRRELVGGPTAPRFSGGSDTEVLLAAIDRWGLAEALKRSVGMFALALWDRERRELSLARDRLGEKPLYYGWVDSTLVFGSELRAVTAHPAFRPTVDRDALALLLRHNCVPAPFCIYEGVRKLPPASVLTLTSPEPTDASPVPFWSARAVAERGVNTPFVGTPEAASRELETLLHEAVGLQMVADVPLGAFLSGGIDSSTVVALMQAQSSRPVRTFSIGSDDDAFNEAHHARAVARHLGTDHTELYVTARDALAIIPRLPSLYDEPFADSSQIPTFLVAQLARQYVTVALSGDAGDELFAGYNRHVAAERIWRWVARLPRAARVTAARALGAPSATTWDRVITALQPVLPAGWSSGSPGDKVRKFAGAATATSAEDLYLRLASHWEDPAAVVIGAREPFTAITDPRGRARLPGLTQRMLLLDLVTYLPDDILTKVDRASMAVGLEARVPFLDHRVVEWAWRLPLSLKIRAGQGKWLLRQVLYRHVPQALVDRPKCGFGLPIGAWLRGPLRPWAEELLDERRLREEGFFHPAPVRARWAQHLSGKRDWAYLLWDVLMFQSWLEANAGHGAASAPALPMGRPDVRVLH
jgi:asparagine synthase (glutamine-hydrolysing)